VGFSEKLNEGNRFQPLFSPSRLSIVRLKKVFCTTKVGGIEPRKNSIALLTAFFQVLTTHPNAQLIIAGGDPNAVEAIAQAMRDVVQPTLAQSLIQQSQTVLSHYTWITAAQMHIKFYCDIQPQ